MVEGQELCIACPYLGLSYLQRILERANGWRLLTDVQEWLSSHSLDSRGRIVNFVVANTQRIRHCKDLHAKVLIAGTRALAGSANFTDKGVTGRVEVPVLFDGCEEVDELRAWSIYCGIKPAPLLNPTFDPALRPCRRPRHLLARRRCRASSLASLQSCGSWKRSEAVPTPNNGSSHAFASRRIVNGRKAGSTLRRNSSR